MTDDTTMGSVLIYRQLLGNNVADYRFERTRAWVEKYAVADVSAAEQADEIDREWFAVRRDRRFRLRPFIPIEFPIDERDPHPTATLVIRVGENDFVRSGHYVRPIDTNERTLMYIAYNILKVPFLLKGTALEELSLDSIQPFPTDLSKT